MNRLAILHCLSETTLSLHSVPETYSSCCICHRLKPFLVKGRKKREKKTEKQSELNELNSGDACVTIFNPVWSSRFPLLYCTHSHWSIKQGGGMGGGKKKMTCDKRAIRAVNVSSPAHSNHVSPICIPSLAKVTRVVTSKHTPTQQVNGARTTITAANTADWQVQKATKSKRRNNGWLKRRKENCNVDG